jgi:hypothetical protein
MADEKITAHRLAAFSDAVFAVIVTVMVLELSAPDEPEFSALWPLWPTAISYAVSYLFIAIIWINHHYLMRFVGAPTLRLIWINFVHLFLVSLLPLCHCMGCAHPARVIPGRVLCGVVCVHRHRLQRLRARSTDPRGSRAGFRSHPAYRETPVTRCSRELHDRDAGCVRRASTRLRSDMRRPDPSRAARCPCQSAVMLLSGAFASQLPQTISPKSG